MKQLFLDVETTGTDPSIHGTWQLAGHVVIDDVEKERFRLECQPLPGQMVSKQAMEATRMEIDRLRTMPPAVDTFREFKKILSRHVDKYNKKDKFELIGYNARFDADFTRAWFENLGDVYWGSWFWFPPIDVMNLCMFMLQRRRGELENFKQSTVASFLNVEFEGPAHEADHDIDVTRRLYQRLVDDPRVL